MLMEADLPDDVEALRAFALEQSRRLADVTLAKAEADAEIERLQSIIDAFMRHRFGARSEQLDPDQLQLGLEDVETALGQARAAREAATGAAKADRLRKTNRGSLPAHLERIEQVVDIEDKACPCCGGALHRIGEDVSERLDVVPATFHVLVTRRPRYGCRSCESAVVQAPAPARIVEGGLPTEALIAQVLVSKYADHLPLYRQAQIYARQGIQLDRSTLADWVGQAAWYLRPLRDHILERLRRSTRLFADETTAPVLDPGRGRTKTGQLWAYARDDRPWGGGGPPMVAYIYAADRKGRTGGGSSRRFRRHPAGRWLWRLRRARQASATDPPRVLLGASMDAPALARCSFALLAISAAAVIYPACLGEAPRFAGLDGKSAS